MSSSPIRLLLVDPDPEGGQALSTRLDRLPGVEIVSVAHNRNAAKAEAESLEPDVLLIDLMLPGLRSIDVVRHVAAALPQVRILALVPADPPHDPFVAHRHRPPDRVLPHPSTDRKGIPRSGVASKLAATETRPEWEVSP